MWLTYTLLASLGFGVGATLQKHGMASEFPKLSFGGLWRDLGRIVRTLFTNWIWLLGVASNLAACVLMTLAMDAGEVSAVLPLLNISLVTSIAIGVIVLRERLLPQEWAGAITLIVGSALISASGLVEEVGPEKVQAVPSLLALVWVFGGCAAGVGLLMGLGRILRRDLPPEMSLAVIAGLLFGMGGVFVKLTTIHLGQIGATAMSAGDGVWLVDIFRDPSTWIAVVIGGVGFVFFQIAFSHGRVAVVVPMVSIAALVPPLVAGIVAFDEAVGALRVSGILVVAVGVALLLVKPAAPDGAPD